MTEWDIPSGYSIVHLSRVDSTNRYLKDAGERFDGEGLVVIADHQTSAYGRYRRHFYCHDSCGLYMSILLRPTIPFDRYSTITTMAALAVSEAIESCFSIFPKIKWVNDLYVDGKKVCGILTEGVFGDHPFAVCGIGVNLCFPGDSSSGDIPAIAGSLFQNRSELGDFFTVQRQFANSVLSHFDRYYREIADCPHFIGYQSRLVGVGQPVSVMLPGSETTAVLEKLNKDFSLTLRYANGTVQTVQSGEISVMPCEIR